MNTRHTTGAPFSAAPRPPDDSTANSRLPASAESNRSADVGLAPAANGEQIASEPCPITQVTRTQEAVDNVPYLAMILLGAAIFWTALDGRVWGWLSAILYFAYGLAGALWIMFFICPYCHFYDTRLCPCGYGQVAAKLRAKRDGARFRAQFRGHIPVIVPLWFAPLMVGAIPLIRHFSWPLLGLLLVFVVNSFVILPLVSRVYGCARCPQKESCPWMGGCKRAHGT
jgi:hypothetical protein